MSDLNTTKGEAIFFQVITQSQFSVTFTCLCPAVLHNLLSQLSHVDLFRSEYINASCQSTCISPLNVSPLLCADLFQSTIHSSSDIQSPLYVLSWSLC